MTRLILVLLAVILPCTSVAGAEIEHLFLNTTTGDLAGTLTVPSYETKVPVALIIAGSGSIDRDGNTLLRSGRNDSLKLLAEALADAGIASLRYDKRGVGGSAAAGPKEEDLRFETYVRDATDWANYLAHDSRSSGVAIIGHSEGALVGMLAAQTASVKAYVSIAGASEPAAAILRRQLDGRLPDDLARRSEAILQSLEAGHVVANIPSQLDILYRISVQPYLISWFKHAPQTVIRKLQQPCLLLQGTTDIQIRIEDAERLQLANSVCDIRVIQEMNHAMKLVPGDPAKQIASYGDPTMPISRELVSAITQFLNRLFESTLH